MNNTNVVTGPGQTWLRRTASGWFAVAAVGQVAFVIFIVAYYGRRTLLGDFSSWNDKPLIDGYIAGDMAGNIQFIAHTLLAIVVTLGGLAQVIPKVRQRAAAFHRWNGRVYMCVAGFLALGGLWLVWVRGTMLSPIAGVATSVNAILILGFGSAAWWMARRGKMAAHRRFALRTFMVVSGVWFLRVGIMAWILINQAPRGMTESMSGPADIALTFGSYLIPLALLELYFAAQKRGRPALTWTAVGVLGVAVCVTALGIFGTVAMMWWPYV